MFDTCPDQFIKICSLHLLGFIHRHLGFLHKSDILDQRRRYNPRHSSIIWLSNPQQRGHFVRKLSQSKRFHPTEAVTLHRPFSFRHLTPGNFFVFRFYSSSSNNPVRSISALRSVSLIMVFIFFHSSSFLALVDAIPTVPNNNGRGLPVTRAAVYPR